MVSQCVRPASETWDSPEWLFCRAGRAVTRFDDLAPQLYPNAQRIKDDQVPQPCQPDTTQTLPLDPDRRSDKEFERTEPERHLGLRRQVGHPCYPRARRLGIANRGRQDRSGREVGRGSCPTDMIGRHGSRCCVQVGQVRVSDGRVEKGEKVMGQGVLVLQTRANQMRFSRYNKYDLEDSHDDLFYRRPWARDLKAEASTCPSRPVRK